MIQKTAFFCLFSLFCSSLVVAQTLSPDLPAVELVEVASGFTAPIGLLSPPDDSQRRFILDEIGVIHILTADGTLHETPFLDIRDRVNEFVVSRNDPRGLLSLVFHPQFAENGRFFIFYTIPPRDGSPANTEHTDILEDFSVDANDNKRTDLASERILLQLDQQTMEHAAGQLLFAPDGYLYVTLGDDNHPDQTSQNLDSLFGGVLRLDVDNVPEGATYGIPADNPFVNADGLDELYAKGLRHPWRISYDDEFGLLISEPAWTFRHSEINRLEAGANYGWDIVPRACYDENGAPIPECQESDGVTLTLPVLEYGQEWGRIVIGGYVYRGAAIPELQGRYVFGEWGLQVSQGAQIFAADPSSGTPWQFDRLHEPFPRGTNIWAFGQDYVGELYVLTMRGGNIVGESGVIYQIVPAS